MRGNTFNAGIIGQTATIWADGPFRGRCGTIVEKHGIGKKGSGWVTIALGTEKARIPFDKVALGDNSTVK